MNELEQQKEVYFNNFLSSIEEEDRQLWYTKLNDVISQLIQLKYCT